MLEVKVDWEVAQSTLLQGSTIMKRALLAALLALVGRFSAKRASSNIYKGKTIIMIVNYPPGGPTDIEGRIVAQHLSRARSGPSDDRCQEYRRRLRAPGQQ